MLHIWTTICIWWELINPMWRDDILASMVLLFPSGFRILCKEIPTWITEIIDLKHDSRKIVAEGFGREDDEVNHVACSLKSIWVYVLT